MWETEANNVNTDVHLHCFTAAIALVIGKTQATCTSFRYKQYPRVLTVKTFTGTNP